MAENEPAPAAPAPVAESHLNRICRENRDLLWIGTRMGIYLGIMLILVVITKMAVMQQIEWAQEQCTCQDWGGDIFSLKTQPKVSNNSGLWIPGVSDGGTDSISK